MWTTLVRLGGLAMVDELRWGPRPAILAGGLGVLAAAAAWLIAARNVADRLVATTVLVVAIAIVGITIRLRDRLRASGGGLVVRTITGPRTFSWAQVHRVEVVSRQRLGTTSTTLEIDLDQDELLVFGRVDLGADPADVAAALSQLRTGQR